ncbi:PREDICTED: vitamin K epoxide reductase complex subunit 1-like protein 1 isoform X2 [Dinoponera quadriceps]|uniref:vitamin-K-epoxide reductase (warfarin-sensitive) n=1 Tax=Dinoponera quadriceps TaxID=609295 RepID=A0A6P3WPZ0_DINQU|nr:PREDICTED: vitamin K epoxide reductase complex subunit 1-like protein 1 isoform X2 [Dinoponera quadriceps]
MMQMSLWLLVFRIAPEWRNLITTSSSSKFEIDGRSCSSHHIEVKQSTSVRRIDSNPPTIGNRSHSCILIFAFTMQTGTNPTLDKVNERFLILCVIGLALSVYAYIVESNKELDASYAALCDISETISCSAVLNSEYSKGFGITSKSCILRLCEVPNCVFGIIFFTAMSIMSLKNSYAFSVAILALGTASVLTSVYLAFILYKLKTICLVCVSTYVVSALLMHYALKKFRLVSTGIAHQQKTK